VPDDELEEIVDLPALSDSEASLVKTEIQFGRYERR
jgi:hypothetical protein